MAIEVPIANFTPVIIRGGVYMPSIKFEQAAGVPEPTSSAKVVVTPNGEAVFEWTQGNGLFINIATGEYRFNLSEADTAAITWDSGKYRIEVVDSNGFTVPCIMEGLIFAEDCN